MSRLPQISNHHRQPYPSDMSDVELGSIATAYTEAEGIWASEEGKLVLLSSTGSAMCSAVDPS